MLGNDTLEVDVTSLKAGDRSGDACLVFSLAGSNFLAIRGDGGSISGKLTLLPFNIRFVELLENRGREIG